MSEFEGLTGYGRPKGFLPWLKSNYTRGANQAGATPQRGMLERLLAYFIGLMVNGFIGFFVQWLIFSNVTWLQVRELFTGDLSGPDALYIFFQCTFWEFWIAAALFVIIFVDLLKTSISPHWPGHGHININLDVPTPTKAPAKHTGKSTGKSTKGLGPLSQHLAMGAMIVMPGTVNRVTGLIDRGRVRLADFHRS